MNVKPEWRRILKHRSVKDKFAVPIHCALAPVEDIPFVGELVREGVIEWIDRAPLFFGIVVACDIYKLTAKGIALCNENGIEQV